MDFVKHLFCDVLCNLRPNIDNFVVALTFSQSRPSEYCSLNLLNFFVSIIKKFSSCLSGITMSPIEIDKTCHELNNDNPFLNASARRTVAFAPAIRKVSSSIMHLTLSYPSVLLMAFKLNSSGRISQEELDQQ